MFGIGFQELVVIFLIIFILFGAKSLPEIVKGLGQAIRSFKREVNDWKDEGESDSAKGNSSQSQTSTSHPDDFKPNSERRDWRPKGEGNHKKV